MCTFFTTITKINIYILVSLKIKLLTSYPMLLTWKTTHKTEWLSTWCYIKESYTSSFTTKLCKTEAVTDTRLEILPLWPGTNHSGHQWFHLCKSVDWKTMEKIKIVTKQDNVLSCLVKKPNDQHLQMANWLK